MTTKINKVDAKTAVANVKANETISLSSIFSKLENNTQGLLKTSLGRKTEIYKEELLKGLNDQKKKAIRKKFRNVSFSILSKIASETDKNKLSILVSSFKEFYKEVYQVNDFSFSSIASENTKEEKKDILLKGLEIAKNFK